MRKKHKAVISTINFGTFHGYAMACIGTNVEEVLSKHKDKGWREYLTRVKEEGFDCDFVHEAKMANGNVYSCVFVSKKGGDEWYIKVAHECFHLCQILAQNYHIDMILEKESMAYQHSHLMRQILELAK